MKTHKIFIAAVLILITLSDADLSRGSTDIPDYSGESILYLLNPLGRAEYNNLGRVDLNGVTVNLVTLTYKILFVETVEKIYSDPENFLPYRIERTHATLWGKKESITEEYDQKKFTVVIKRFKGKKLLHEQMVTSNGPIQNVVLLLFYLRRNPGLSIGWNFTARVPSEFKPELVSIKLELVSIGPITVPAGKFQAYHFKSVPPKFELWINKNTPQVPLKIKLKSIFDCSVSMKGYTVRNNSK